MLAPALEAARLLSTCSTSSRACLHQRNCLRVSPRGGLGRAGAPMAALAEAAARDSLAVAPDELAPAEVTAGHGGAVALAAAA